MLLAASLTLIGLAALAAASDVLHRRVSNRLNLVILILGLGWRAALSGDVASVALGAAGAAVGLAMLLPVFAVRWTGAGDVKLLAAFGAWLGPGLTVYAGLFGIAGGGLLAAAIAIAGGAQLRRAVASSMFVSMYTLTAPAAPQRARRHVVPMAVPFAVAAVATWFAAGGR
jgi:prepilin peptidase CpaA